ncbi:murein L,D-transpeptidase [Acidovorax carolinensis]|nr:murein L,D-transpeptidase [Acidovorax carolinensis]
MRHIRVPFLPISSALSFFLDASAMLRSTLLALCLAASAAVVGAAPWLVDGRPAPVAHQAVNILAGAATEGLQPEDYHAAALAQAVADAAHGPALDADAALRLEDALTTSVQRYLGDLRSGRIDPRQIHQNYTAPALPQADAATALQNALAAPSLAEAVRATAPPVPLYASLRSELARYRALGNPAAWETPLPPLPGRKLEPGQTWAGLAQLTQRLVVLGDLPPDTLPTALYDEALQNGVKAFQQRHALASDGVIGKGTLDALAVSPAARARQIELAMERLRWTPLLRGPRMIVVNIPEFVLRAYEVQGGRVSLQLAMKVIVGKALDTRTPLFDEDMRFIEFSPYWNIPPSIARSETIPRLRRDPGYLQQQGMEFVGANGQVHTTLAAEHLDAVLRGQMRIRQRPGPKNALGDIKFVFPNNSNIYLHHTPAPLLFQRDRRDFSHGCIRIEDPVALAQFVLRNDPAWPESRIREAMGRGQSATLRLAEPLPVVIAYSTAIVKQGKLYFFADLYGQDKLLDRALRQQSEQRRLRAGPGLPAAAQ